MTTPETETISFPSRSSDLANDSYWAVSEFSEGIATMDLNVRRWDGNNWQGGNGNGSNAADYSWDVPIYAPASGFIASSWRNFPDDPVPGTNPPNNDKIFAGGNHVVIITDEGNAISLNHFKAGTIPAHLCPRNSGTEQFPTTMDKEGAWRLGSYIEPADRPRVNEGDYLGRAGNSGKSSGPHLHMSQSAITGTDSWGREALAGSAPMRFRHVWGHRFEKSEKDTPGGWYRWRGNEFKGNADCDSYRANAPECGFKMVHPSPYLRRASASAGTVKDVAAAFISSNRAVTAVIDSNSKLKLIAWDLVGVETIKRRGDIDAGEVKQVEIAEPASNFALVAVRGSQNELKLKACHVGPTGNLAWAADATAGPIKGLTMSVTRGPNRRAVTAVRDADGDLKVIVWDVQVANDGTASVVRLGDASAGSVSALSIAPARHFDGVYTAVRDGDGNLKVIPWRISADGKTVTRGEAASAGAVGTQIAVAPLGKGVAVAMRDDDGNLRVISWSVSAGGDIGKRRGTGVAGAITEVSLLGTPHAGSNLSAIVRDSAGRLLLIGWAIDDNGDNLRRLGSSDAGAATKIAAVGVSRSYPGLDPRDMVLTALRDSDGELKLITWDTNLNNP